MRLESKFSKKVRVDLTLTGFRLFLPVDINLVLAVWPNIYDLGFFSAKPNRFLKKIINIGPLGGVMVNKKDISFHKKPEALFP